jgi:hypothetical protein
MTVANAGKIAKQLQYATFLLKHPAASNAFRLHKPPFLSKLAPPIIHRHGFRPKRAGVAATQTAKGGENVEVNDGGTHYMISLSYTSNTLATNVAEGANGQAGAQSTQISTQLVSQASANYPQPIGVVRAYPMPGGRVGIIVDGSTQNTELTINPLGQQQRKGFAHSFAYGAANRGHVLNIGQITINTGEIADIEGFQDAVLSGPLVISGTTAVDRIALEGILPGGSITTGGDVNTLDVLTGITLTGTNIDIGRDLNLLNVGQNITLSDGSQFIIGRNLGLVSQPPKGTGTGTNVLTLNYTTVANSIVTVTIPAVGSYIQGNVVVNPGSLFSIGGNIFNTMYVAGSVTAGAIPVPVTPASPFGLALTRLTIKNGTPATLLQTMLNATTDQGFITAFGGFA